MGSTDKRNIWFWQGIISPHMAGLAVALARRGCDVTYVARQAMSDDRASQGWSPPALEGVQLRVAESDFAAAELAASAPVDSIHLCGGLRSNGPIGAAQTTLAQRSIRQWAVIETVDDAGWLGALKRMEYSRLFHRWRERLQGVLAIGHKTPAWVAARGMPAKRVFPFAYFLPRPGLTVSGSRKQGSPYRLIFVGQLIRRKRLDLLINSLRDLASDSDGLRLTIVGNGPLEEQLRKLAAQAIPGRVDWLGSLPMEAVSAEMAQADCLGQ